MLNAGATITLPADGGGPLLLDAASAGCGRLLDSLLARGADRDYVNRRGETLLHRAAQGGLKGAVETELGRGVKVDVRMFSGDRFLYSDGRMSQFYAKVKPAGSE